MVDRVYGILNQAAADLGVGPLVPDPRLERVAKALSGLSGPASKSEQNVTELCWLHGLVEPVPTVLNVETNDPGGQAALKLIRKWAAGLLASGRFRRVASWVRKTRDGWKFVVAVQEVHLDMDPVPRQVPCRRPIRIRGRLDKEFRRPKVAVTGPDGRITEMSLQIAGSRFAGRIALKGGKGRYQVELLAEGPTGPTVLANFPLYCGVDAPRSFRVREPESGPRDPLRAERYLFEAVNRERHGRGLPVLIWNKVLARVARNHSAEMCQTGDFGHRSARSGRPEDRVRRAGVAASMVAENVASASNAASAHDALMASPGHRANILTKDLAEVGIGAVLCRMAHGGVQLMVTELFIRPAAP